MVKSKFIVGAKHIPLNKGKFAIVDEDDYWKLSKFKWTLSDDGYAIRSRTGSTKGVSYIRFIRIQGENVNLGNVFMHQEIINIPSGFVCDHINRNKLDNRKINLRIATNSQNQFNHGKYKSKFGYKGIGKQFNKYRAIIQFNGKQISKSGFDSAIDAARCYDEMALKYHGEFACTNKMLGLL